MSKAERLPRWKLRRLNAEQREAHNQLLWYSPGPAERARLKQVLGWRRTREETVALAVELFEQGLMESVVADRLGVSDRYLRRLLTSEGQTPKNRGFNPSRHAAKVAPTCKTNRVVPLAGIEAEKGPSRWLGGDDAS